MAGDEVYEVLDYQRRYPWIKANKAPKSAPHVLVSPVA